MGAKFAELLEKTKHWPSVALVKGGDEMPGSLQLITEVRTAAMAFQIGMRGVREVTGEEAIEAVCGIVLDENVTEEPIYCCEHHRQCVEYYPEIAANDKKPELGETPLMYLHTIDGHERDEYFIELIWGLLGENDAGNPFYCEDLAVRCWAKARKQLLEAGGAL